LKPLYKLLDTLKGIVRKFMHHVARLFNNLSGGRLTPNTVTIVGLLMHVPIAWLIAFKYNLGAAALLVVFGLFDTLDGELARLQKRASNTGMLLDASTDRFKEVMLYTGVAYALIHSAHPNYAAWAVAACGASLSVSYVKAKGELAISGSGMDVNKINKTMFRDGILSFEIRMSLLVIGLLSNHLAIITAVIAVLSAYTAIERLVKATRYIK
jgi:CDP-diacylglycerol--glycerol-3-phosphate 3-phosphatidyltransferase